MAEVRKNNLLKLERLLGDRFGEHRMTMAMECDPPTADGID